MDFGYLQLIGVTSFGSIQETLGRVVSRVWACARDFGKTSGTSKCEYSCESCVDVWMLHFRFFTPNWKKTKHLTFFEAVRVRVQYPWDARLWQFFVSNDPGLGYLVLSSVDMKKWRKHVSKDDMWARGKTMISQHQYAVNLKFALKICYSGYSGCAVRTGTMKGLCSPVLLIFSLVRIALLTQSVHLHSDYKVGAHHNVFSTNRSEFETQLQSIFQLLGFRFGLAAYTFI